MASDDARGRPAQAPPIEKIAQEAIVRFSAHGDIQRQIQNRSEFDQRTHFVAMLLISLSIALIMTPAAYQRQVEPGSVFKFFLSVWLPCSLLLR